MSDGGAWGADFDPDELARLETRMWKAYYRRQPARLFADLIEALHVQARVSWPRTIGASLLLTRAAAGFARSTGDYERFAPDIGRAYRMLGLPDHVDAEAVARHELRWWVVRRELGLTPAPRPATRSRICTSRSTTSRASAWRRPADCAGWPPKSATAAPPPIRTDRKAQAARTGRRSRASFETRTEASTRASRRPRRRPRSD